MMDELFLVTIGCAECGPGLAPLEAVTLRINTDTREAAPLEFGDLCIDTVAPERPTPLIETFAFRTEPGVLYKTVGNGDDVTVNVCVEATVPPCPTT